MKEEEAGILAQARMNLVLLDHLKPVIVQNMQSVMSRMKNLYRSGEQSPLAYINCVAELVALDNIELALKQKINQAGRLEKKKEEGNLNANTNA